MYITCNSEEHTVDTTSIGSSTRTWVAGGTPFMSVTLYLTDRKASLDDCWRLRRFPFAGSRHQI